jgi:hypothetical protein
MTRPCGLDRIAEPRPDAWRRARPDLLLGLGMGCSGILPTKPTETVAASYFEIPAPDDVWSPKIEGWQRRERFDAELLAPLESGPAVESAGWSEANRSLPTDQQDENGLRAKYFRFRAERKRAMAADVAEWIQAEAKQVYREDGAVDHWATFEETLARGGDDCDGLELLVFHALRDLGFAETEVYRAIVVRPSTASTTWSRSGSRIRAIRGSSTRPAR